MVVAVRLAYVNTDVADIGSKRNSVSGSYLHVNLTSLVLNEQR